MTAEIISFAFGGLLILIGILGGGLEVRKLKIPKVGPGARILAAVGGLSFITLGIGIQSRGTTPEKASSSPVNFTISDVLGDEQVSERMTVVIDGRNVGDLTVNEQYPRSTITVTVPQEGKYNYVLDTSAVFKGDNAELHGVGQGTIDVKPEKAFTARSCVNGNTWIATLMEGSR
jgi:hypothetical protein